mmetsp:Transcript_30971/g.46972  ORF Transcript_30971/g.46972 Transcript_30971/m.46972 type:complete len:350 (+) Transcript_30971:2634-3683(+)
MGIVIVAFSDMIHIAKLSSEGGNLCNFSEGETITDDYCSINFFEGYIRTYAITVGFLELDDFRDSTYLSIIFVVFTFLALIVLVNVLIAIVSDSYEKSRVKSAYLFGRARVQFALENASLEAFLRPTRQGRNCFFLGCLWNWHQPDWRYLLIKVIRTFVLSYILAAAVITDVLVVHHLRDYGESGPESIPSFFVLAFLSAILLLILNVAIIVIIEFLIKTILNSDAHFFTLRASDGDITARQGKLRRYSTFIVREFIRFISEKVFGIKHSIGSMSEDEEDWPGRLNYIEKITTHIVAESERNVSAALTASETRLMKHESALQLEVRRDIEKYINKIERPSSIRFNSNSR